jgi:hypothetical protein
VFSTSRRSLILPRASYPEKKLPRRTESANLLMKAAARFAKFDSVSLQLRDCLADNGSKLPRLTR